MEKSLLGESFGLSLQAIALVKAIRDLVLTDEQRKQIPELYVKHATIEANLICDRIGIEHEKLFQSLNLEFPY